MSKEVVANFKLTKELKRDIDRLVQSGRYASQSELLREAVRHLLDAERTRLSQMTPLTPTATLIPPGEVKAIDEWITELEGQWISRKSSDEMIEEERER